MWIEIPKEIMNIKAGTEGIIVYKVQEEFHRALEKYISSIGELYIDRVSGNQVKVREQEYEFNCKRCGDNVPSTLGGLCSSCCGY